MLRFKACSAKPRTLLCALFLLLPLSGYSQQNKLLVQPPVPLTIKRGAIATAKLNLTVIPGFHINSDKPRDEFLIPLKLTWISGPLESQTISYPTAEEITVGKDNLLVFSGKISLESKFFAPANAPAGPAVMTGKVRYQACNNQMCFRPSSADVRLSVSIE